MNKAKPGIGGSTFNLVFQEDFNLIFKEDWWKPENLEVQEIYAVKIIKVYKFTWWKKILFKLGFPFCHFECTLIKD